MIKIGEVYMNLIDEKILEKLSLWAEKNADKNVFREVLNDDVSYFINRDSEETYMIEYSPETEIEVKEYLDKYTGQSLEQEILKDLTIAICQNKYRATKLDDYVNSIKNNQSTKDSDDKKMLPEFIYVF